MERILLDVLLSLLGWGFIAAGVFMGVGSWVPGLILALLVTSGWVFVLQSRRELQRSNQR